MIEVIHPELADLIFIETCDSLKADVIIYKTDNKECADAWDLMWKFKRWGFSNFAVYISSDPFDDIFINEDSEKQFKANAIVYFTNNPTERKYRNPSFHIEGLMKIKKSLYLPSKKD